MKKLYTALKITVMALALVGCLQQQVNWQKYGASNADFNRDKAQCDYETSSATQGVDYSYRTVIGQALDQAMRKNELMAKCLTARGYIAE